MATFFQLQPITGGPGWILGGLREAIQIRSQDSQNLGEKKKASVLEGRVLSLSREEPLSKSVPLRVKIKRWIQKVRANKVKFQGLQNKRANARTTFMGAWELSLWPILLGTWFTYDLKDGRPDLEYELHLLHWIRPTSQTSQIFSLSLSKVNYSNKHLAC